MVARDVFGFLLSSEGRPAVCHDLVWRSLINRLESPEEREEDEVALPCHATYIEQGMGVTWLHFSSQLVSLYYHEGGDGSHQCWYLHIL